MTFQRMLTMASVAATLLFLGWGADLFWFATRPLDPSQVQKVILEVQPGATGASVTQELVRVGAIDDPWRLMWLARTTRAWRRLKTGEYEISASQTPLQILETLGSGKSVNHPFTVPEGENLYEIAAAVEKAGVGPKEEFIALCKDSEFIAGLGFGENAPPTLEGYLFPETYFLARQTSIRGLVEKMVRRSLAFWSEETLAKAASMGLSRHEAVTLASMIEKETGAPEERPLISSVFHNRLKKRMRLQSDPTTIYGMWDHYEGKLSRADLRTPSPYNTYTVPALPVGPIANPGTEALQAALTPAESSHLFFVSRNDGTHEFTDNLTDHNSAVEKLQRDPKAREGKSWRDLTRKLETERGATVKPTSRRSGN